MTWITAGIMFNSRKGLLKKKIKKNKSHSVQSALIMQAPNMYDKLIGLPHYHDILAQVVIVTEYNSTP